MAPLVLDAASLVASNVTETQAFVRNAGRTSRKSTTPVTAITLLLKDSLTESDYFLTTIETLFQKHAIFALITVLSALAAGRAIPVPQDTILTVQRRDFATATADQII